MPEIIERNFVYGGTARGIRLYNEELIRPLSFGNNWSKLRIVLNIGVNDGLNTVNAILDVGVCSGTVRGIGSNNPVNYVGSGVGGGPSGRYTANRITTSSGFTGGWLASSGQRHITAQHGATVDGYVNDNAGTFYIGTTGLANGVYRRQLHVMDIQRVSRSQCILASYPPSPSAGVGDVVDSSMTEACEAAFNATFSITLLSFNTGLLESVSYSYPTPTTVNWDEANGPLDSLNIAWSSTSIPCILWGIAVTRFQ